MRKPVMHLLAALAITLTMSGPARGEALADGRAAYARKDFVRAAGLLTPLAERGSAEAQLLLGMMHATGRGLPQSYVAAAHWYCLSAEQGNTAAQHLLGLLYDKGQGVPIDEVAAYMWLALATAGAPAHTRDYYQRLRDAVASKMTRGQIALGQALALQWAARRH